MDNNYIRIDFGKDPEGTNGAIERLKHLSDYIKNNFPDKIEETDSSNLFEHITGDLIWDDDTEGMHYFNCPGIFYLILLIDLINTLFYFLIDISEDKKEKNYFYKSQFVYQAYVLLVNNIKADGYIYLIIHGIPLPINANGEMGTNPDAPYIGHQELLDFMFDEQETYDKQIAQHPELGKKGFKQYLKHTPEELVKKVLPCFIKNIHNLPSDSILWQTPILKQTMANYEALKKYAEEQGWL